MASKNAKDWDCPSPLSDLKVLSEINVDEKVTVATKLHKSDIVSSLFLSILFIFCLFMESWCHLRQAVGLLHSFTF